MDDATQRRRLRNSVEQSRQLQSDTASCRTRSRISRIVALEFSVDHPIDWSYIAPCLPSCPSSTTRRKQFKKAKLRWRTSRGPRRSLGWIPWKVEQIKRQGKCLRFCGKSRYLARGGAVQRLEGDVPIHWQVILEFPNMERLNAFYNSAEYQALLIIRQRAAKSKLLAIEGV